MIFQPNLTIEKRSRRHILVNIRTVIGNGKLRVKGDASLIDEIEKCVKENDQERALKLLSSELDSWERVKNEIKLKGESGNARVEGDRPLIDKIEDKLEGF